MKITEYISTIKDELGEWIIVAINGQIARDAARERIKDKDGNVLLIDNEKLKSDVLGYLGLKPGERSKEGMGDFANNIGINRVTLWKCLNDNKYRDAHYKICKGIHRDIIDYFI